MAAQRPQISPWGWFVELPEPADALVRRRRESREGPEDVAGLAQARLYLLQHPELVDLLGRLEKAGGRYLQLAHALRAEDLMRRGECEPGRKTLHMLSRTPGPFGAWAALREVEPLE